MDQGMLLLSPPVASHSPSLPAGRLYALNAGQLLFLRCCWCSNLGLKLSCTTTPITVHS